MWSPFKKAVAKTVRSVSTLGSGSRSSSSADASFPRPIPVPDVIEGNDDSDWAMWEDSVAFQDSHPVPQENAPTQPANLEECTPPPQAYPVDPFANVHKNHR